MRAPTITREMPGSGFAQDITERESEAYLSFADAVAAAGSNPVTILIEQIEQVTANLTIGSNIVLNFRGRGRLNIANGVTVTINSFIAAAFHQIFSGLGTVVGSFDWQTEILPEWWGAKPSAIEFDSAPAIQDAINFCEARIYGNVMFQDGIYYWCNSALTIQSDRVRLCGWSKRTSIIHKNFEDGSLLSVGQVGSQVEYNGIDNLRFDVDAAITSKGIGIDVVNAANFTMVDVMSINFYNNLVIHCGSTTCYYTRCIFSDATNHGVHAPYDGEGADYWAWAQFFTECQISNNAGYGMKVNNIADLYISRCQVNSNTGMGIAVGPDNASDTKVNQVCVRDCEVDSNGSQGIFISKYQFLDISNNVVGSGRTGNTNGIHITNCEEGVVSTNRAINNGLYGIYLLNSDYINVIDNIAVDNADEGIRLSTMNHVILSGNQCSKKGDLGDQDYGIRIEDACTYITVVGNEARDNDTSDFYNNATSLVTHTIEGNDFEVATGDFTGSVVWDPGSIANGAEEAQDVTVTGAELGDFAIASFSLDVLDLVLNAQITAANTVTCILANNTGGAIDLGSGTVSVKVIKN